VVLEIEAIKMVAATMAIFHGGAEGISSSAGG
jgi:hypothetical protein